MTDQSTLTLAGLNEDPEVRFRVAGVTPNGKEILIVPTNTGTFKIIFRPGGELPQDLSGRYTRYEFAQHAINRYLALKPKSKKDNAKTFAKSKLQ